MAYPDDHICEICYESFLVHRDDHYPPRCCVGCPCGSARPGTLTPFTIISIPHEKLALELCAELVKQGKTFRCEKKPGGWEFEVLS